MTEKDEKRINNYEGWKEVILNNPINARTWTAIGDWYYANRQNAAQTGLFYHMCKARWMVYLVTKNIPPHVLDKNACLACGLYIPENVLMVYYLTERL